MKLVIIIAGFLFIFIPAFRCLVLNLHNVVIYSGYDLYTYIRDKKWKLFNEYGITMYIGMFGHGKTLSMVHKTRKLYNKYGNSLRFISNFKLIGIPYTPLENFNQLLDLMDEKPLYYADNEKPPVWYYDKKGHIKREFIDFDYDAPAGMTNIRRWIFQGNVVLIDEIEDVLSHRNYADFPLQLCSIITQQRKFKTVIFCTAQRFFMVDKIWRGITTFVVDCNKYWRFQSMRYYDAWDYENAMTPTLIKPLFSRWWFVHNKYFDSYDTSQAITADMCDKFISNDEQLSRIGLDSMVNEQAVNNPSRKLRKRRKRLA